MTQKIQQYRLDYADDGAILIKKFKYDYSPQKYFFVNVSELLDRLQDIVKDKEQAQDKAYHLIHELTEAIPGSD